MRVIEYCDFNIKTKIPFSDWTNIVHTYLRELGLSYKEFYYYFGVSVSKDDKEEYEYNVKKALVLKF